MQVCVQVCMHATMVYVCTCTNTHTYVTHHTCPKQKCKLAILYNELAITNNTSNSVAMPHAFFIIFSIIALILYVAIAAGVAPPVFRPI